MALDKAGLATALAAAFGVSAVSDPTTKANVQSMCNQIADAVDTFVKSGTVTTVVTIPSTGSPGGPSAGTGVGTVT